jgi:hypothetical protein
MVDRSSGQRRFSACERDQVSTELRYVTRHHEWNLPDEIVAKIVDWHLETIAVDALSCIRFYAMAGADNGARAKATLEPLLAAGLRPARAEVTAMG